MVRKKSVDTRMTVRDIARSHVRESIFKKKAKSKLTKCWSALNKPVLKFKQTPIEYVDMDFEDTSFLEDHEEPLQAKPEKLRPRMKGKKDDMLEKLGGIYKL